MGSVIFVAETTSPLIFLSIVYVILFLSNLHIAMYEPVINSFDINTINYCDSNDVGKYLR